MDDQCHGGHYSESGWITRRSLSRTGHTLVWIFVETLTCSYPLASSETMEVKHLIILFCILSFMMFLDFFMHMS